MLIVLQSVTVNSAAKYSYNHPSYGDRSLREFEDPEAFDTEYGNGERRFRKYHPSYRYRSSRSGRERHGVDRDQERAYYEGPSRQDDPSIEVIVDPGKKKAVAVIENGPAGQSRYELTGYAMAKEPDMQQASANLDNPVGKADRKRSRNYEMGDKEKRNAELTKRKINKASKMAHVPLKQDYTDAQVGGLPTKRKSEDNKDTAAENCPPHLEEQAKERNEEEQQSKNSVKREVANAFSESQLNILTDSLARVKDSGEDVENLKRVLYDMGLVQNSKRDIERSVDREQTKRDLQVEDEDLGKDNIVMKRDSEAADEDAWNEDEQQFDEQMDKRDAESDNWEDTEGDEEMADEPADKMNYGTGEVKMNDAGAKETADAEVPMRDKRQNKETVENAEENQNEMIDNYAKELEQANLEAAARSKREQDKSKMKPSKDDAKRSDKDEDKLIKEAESQVPAESNDKKKLTKRDDATEAKEKRQESDETKKKMESEIKEKIQMIKEKVKREILEENAEKARDGYYKNASFQRNVRAADSLDLDGSFKRSKRDLSGSVKENEDDLKQYVLNRRANSDGNETKIAIDYKYNQTDLTLNDSKVLDPIVESHDLEPIIRQHRQVNVTGLAKIDEPSQDNNVHADDCKELPPAVRKRRDTATSAKELEEGVIRQKRANGDPEKQMVYEPFQNGEVDETEEEGEFGDNYKDNRLYIDKRQARNEEDYFEEPQQQRGQQYEERNEGYFDGESNPGRRRRSFAREDNARTDDREKREPLDAKLTDEEEYSENLYFGPLSKTYNEDLVRYKRVKRDKP
ncbi:hypothetical protein CBL_04434 [Carabus blaptoides fortunei]